MSIQVGDQVPNIQTKALINGEICDISTGDLFKGKKTVLFGLPGAFTGTCSKIHFPGYIKNAAALTAKGVDQIICFAVNDIFVMDAWSKDVANTGDVIMLSDGNCEMTTKMGLDFDGSAFTLGKRCKRFALIINDGKVEHLDVDEPGTCSVSSAETILGLLG